MAERCSARTGEGARLHTGTVANFCDYFDHSEFYQEG